MTHVRRNLTRAEARSYMKTALWERHGEHLSQADYRLITPYAQSLVSLTETREDMPNLTDSELTNYLSILVKGLHKSIGKGE